MLPCRPCWWGPPVCSAAQVPAHSAQSSHLTNDTCVWIRIRIRGSMPLTNGSGSSCFHHWHSRRQQKTNKKSFLHITFWRHLHHFSKIKRQKKLQNSRNQGFSYNFCLIIDLWLMDPDPDPGGPKTFGSGGFGSGFGSGSATLDRKSVV